MSQGPDLLSLDESRADALLLELVPRGAAAAADLFVERTRRAVLGVQILADGERGGVPLLRDDRGVALRRLSPQEVRGVHVSGEADDVSISGGRSQFSVRPLSIDDYPRLPSPDAGHATRSRYPEIPSSGCDSCTHIRIK